MYMRYRVEIMSCFCFMIIFFIFIKKNIKYKKEIKMLRSYLEKQENYINDKREREKQITGFRHDIKNHMIMLKEYINNNDIEGARQYIFRISQNIEATKRIKYTGIVTVDAVISELCHEMDKDIKFSWQGELQYAVKTDMFDLCILLSNIISNAVEACSKCKGEKFINMKIYQYNNTIKIYEENTYNGEIRTDKNGKIVTLKKDKCNHGIGSRNIYDVIEKYDGEIKLSYDNNIFKINIII